MTAILDGGMGRELQRLGAPFRQPEWSALADVGLAETLSTLGEAELVGEMLAHDDRPLWLSFTLNDEGTALLRSGETIEAAVAVARKLGVEAILFNCCAPEVMEDAVQSAKAALDGEVMDIGVYANGFAHSYEEVDANAGLRPIRADLDPASYLDWAKKWAASGANVVGGGCGIGPEHIRALAGGL